MTQMTAQQSRKRPGVAYSPQVQSIGKAPVLLTDTTAQPAPLPREDGPRLGWLDALRGVAALAVVFQHLGPYLLPHAEAAVDRRMDLGIFGVMLFFLVSGYIVPASLERRGDVRGFWVGRIFRLYPLYLTVIAAAVFLLPQRFPGVQTVVFHEPLLSAVGNGTLLQFVTGVPNALSVAWTLSFEMVFYYLVSALFVLRLHRRSAPIAVGFAALALVSGLLSDDLLSRTASDTRLLTAAVTLIVVAALGGIISGRVGLVRAGALLLGATGLVLLLVNSRSAGFESMMILAMMFSGTVLFRAEQGQIKRWTALTAVPLVIVAGVVSSYHYGQGKGIAPTWAQSWSSWCAAFLAAWLLFGLAMLARRRRFPAVLPWLGKISYATYLIHLPLAAAMRWMFHAAGYQPRGTVQGGACMLAFLAVLLTVSYAAHRLIELPGQKLGRNLLRRGTGGEPRTA
jgi:peptidoglycan/LPS O-acetylase OafA/YrhL